MSLGSIGYGSQSYGSIGAGGGTFSLVLLLSQNIPAVKIDTDSSVQSLAQALNLESPSITIASSVKIIVINASNFAISEYVNFAFNSMGKLNDKFLYARADGIYEGGGNSDNGISIAASYKTGKINIYKTEIQRLRDAYLKFRSNGDIQLFSVGNGALPRSYIVTNSTNGTIHERRVKFERGIKERRFNFGISNVAGSTFEINKAKVLTEPIRKRR